MVEGHAARWFALSAILAFAAWLAFVGNVSRQELALGAASALFSSALSAFVLKRMGIPLRVKLSDAVNVCWVPWYLITDAWEILVVLAKDIAGVSRARSLFRAIPFECMSGRRGFVRRALAVVCTTATPSFIVIGIDEEHRLMLFHQVQRSETPRMTLNLGAGA